MKFVFVAVLAVLALPLIGRAQHSVCSEKATADDAVLTICTQVHGMRGVRPPQLDLRLYADGRGEYETDPDGVLTQREIRITSEKVKKILRLGRAADFQKARDSYQPLIHKTDSSSQTIITFNDRGRSKRIVLSNFYIKDPRNKTHYPASLLRLMRLAEEIHTPSVAVHVLHLTDRQPFA